MQHCSRHKRDYRRIFRALPFSKDVRQIGVVAGIGNCVIDALPFRTVFVWHTPQTRHVARLLRLAAALRHPFSIRLDPAGTGYTLTALHTAHASDAADTAHDHDAPFCPRSFREHLPERTPPLPRRLMDATELTLLSASLASLALALASLASISNPFRNRYRPPPPLSSSTSLYQT
jgi:hypothetical protein